MVKRKNNKKNKEDYAEPWCFICKDGGKMRICDFRDCLKSYHAECVKQDASFLKSNNKWCCGSHYCYLCDKAPKFMCYCCPTAVCGNCFFDSEFATVKGNKGFCRHCSKLASLIEKNADVDSDGEKIDMRDPDAYESYFLEYYDFIKKNKGLNSQHVLSARDLIKKGKTKCDLDPEEIGEEDDYSGETDVSNFEGSDLDDTAGFESARRKKKCTEKLKSANGKVVKDNKKDFVGWGSRSLIDFLVCIGTDTTKEVSEQDVNSIIVNYCTKNNLFDPQKRRRIICDEKLRNLLRRKSVNKNNIPNLLASHFAENFEEIDDVISSSEEKDHDEASKFPKQRSVNSITKSCHNLVSEELPSCFAAIISSNLKLVYLKRSLIKELSKQPETFDAKVLGSFVRTKADPNDYLQKNSHLLLQVIGINKGEMNQEILLRLSYVPKDVPISKISDDDFSEEECQDLNQRMRDGLLKKPTILELEQKARTLHEDIMKHWISRELALLQNLIDRANEKGWRRQLAQYIDQKLKLESLSEQSRLLSEIPGVVPEMVGTNMSLEDSSRKDKLEENNLPELAIGETCVGQNGFAQCLDKRTNVLGPKTPVKNNQDGTAFPATVEQLPVHSAPQDTETSPKNLIQYKVALLKEPNSDCQAFDPAKYGLPQPSNTTSGSDVGCINLSAPSDANLTVKERQNITVLKESNSDCQAFDPAKYGLSQPSNITSGSDVGCINLSAHSANLTVKKRQSITVADPVKTTVNDVIVLSDSDEEDADNKDKSAGGMGVENPNDSIWLCSGVYSETRGPFSMSALKLWSESTSSLSEFKVWKTGESDAKAIPLRDALKLYFP